MVRPKRAFRPNFNGIDTPSLFLPMQEDPKQLDLLLEDIEPLQLRVPTLIKKYLKQNAQIIGFNRDPQFSDALDGFMIAETKGLQFV